MKKYLLLMVLFGLVGVKSICAQDVKKTEEPGFCNVSDDPNKKSPCNVEGGFFTKEEVKDVVKKDSHPVDAIHKEMFEGKVHLYLFYAYDCPHCKKAHEFLEELKKQYPDLDVMQYEIKNNQDNLKFFQFVAKSYDVPLQGVPTIFIGDKSFVGFDENVTCTAIIKEVRRLKGFKDSCESSEIDVPMIGTINIHTISLPMFTVYVGLL
ncbi:MAG: DsbA family protein, partial [bacterium]